MMVLVTYTVGPLKPVSILLEEREANKFITALSSMADPDLPIHVKVEGGS